MVYNYTRKTQRASWTEDTMREAIKEAKRSSIKGASRKYGIPLSTLQRRVKSGSCTKHLGRFRPIFTELEEGELVQHLKELDALFYGLTRSEFMQLVGEYAKRKNKQVPFRNGIAGKQWFKNFKKRHPEIVLRTPESTSIARLAAFNKPAVNRFYGLLENTIKKENIRQNMIYNMDETGVRTSASRPPKVLSVYGKKQVGMVSSLEKGTLTTVVCCCSSSGNFSPPPFFIFKRKRFQARLLDGAMTGCEASVSDSGWINGEIFLEWLRFFVSHVRPTQDCKALLILDNHESHKFYPALEYATKNNVIFLTIPPHTSHKLQPLDVSVYAPFKTFFELEINKFQKQHPGRVIGQYEIARLVTQAYLKAATPQNALSGFSAAGIQPFDRHAIGDEHFAPSAVYDCDSQETQEPTNPVFNVETSSVMVSEEIPASQQIDNAADVLNVRSESDRDLLLPEDILTGQQLEGMSTPLRSLSPKPNGPLNDTQILQLLSEEIPTAQQIEEGRALLQNNSTNPEKSSEILRQILPLPQRTTKQTNRRRKQQRAEILTNTPIKNEQKEKYEKNLTKRAKIPKPSTSVQKKKKKQSNPPQTDKENEYFCTVCKEKYTNPPIEDWIQCSQCQEWTHESCSAYSGHGSYFCDNCNG